MSTLSNRLDRLTVEGELYEKLAKNSVRCFACGHRCLIREGKRGICQVRFNEGGRLMVPHGYVAALQSDPIEKKPFSHVLPGSNALTFGMLGCDYHCSYCFTGDTMVITDRGPIELQTSFELGETRIAQPGGDISFPQLKAVASSGNMRKVKGVFRHTYRGDLVNIKPYYLPALRCTPDHRVFATDDFSKQPVLVYARDLSSSSYLAVPKKFIFSSPQVIDVEQLLGMHQVTYQTPWNLSKDEMQTIMDLSADGKTSREIGAMFGKSGSYIRHLRVKIRNGRVTDTKTSGAYVENGFLRFPNERQPGIPVKIELSAELAELLGYYCAEGSIVGSDRRPNSFSINFSFSKIEGHLADRVIYLLGKSFGVEGRLVWRETTLSVSVSKASLALLITTLAGARSTEKQVPEMLFDAPLEIVQSFLDAYIEGDGHKLENGKVSSTTVSKKLAYGVAWLALKCGYLPSIYDNEMTELGNIQGRIVHRAPHQYTVVWYETNEVQRKIVETEDFHLVPLRGIEVEPFDGNVFNMEVEGEHNYLAGFFLVSNCQNWLTSQAMRDPASDVSAQFIREITPDLITDYALRTKAAVVVSSYNEPLITSEWAVEVFKSAKANGLKCAYVSNGNNTPEVMDYLAPYLSAYKIDLKCMNDKNYRALSGTLQHTLDGIKRAREHGLWVEVVTLVIPGFNDSNEELWDAARFLAEVSPDIPWHVTAFHKDYKMTDPDNTDARTLIRAAEIGREAGLNFVYAGNLPGMVEAYEDTHCPKCSYRLVMRRGYVIREYHLTGEGNCPQCGQSIPGIWAQDPAAVGLNGLGFPRGLR